VAVRTYRLIVEGELGDQLESAFEGMSFTHVEGTTTMTGDLRDQAELQGVLQRVSALGLTLLEARAIDDRLERDPGEGPPDGVGPRPAAVPQTHEKGARHGSDGQ
jgi:hypothetical protein